MKDIENPGAFYLGRKYDLAAGEVSPQSTLYDSKNLTTHAVCVGMTGSGKTGLCLSLIEEAGLDGVPVIAIDPKGDLGNLLLTFPELRPKDFAPWVDPGAASRKGITPEELAEQTATLWKNGLADWGQDGERIRRYNDSVEKTIYTPGSSAGIPLTVLKSFNAPSQQVIDDRDAFRDRVQSTTSGVLALLGIDADPVQSREHIFLSNVLDRAWREGRSLDLPSLIHEIQDPPFKKVGVVDLETFYPAKDRLALGMKLNNLLASPSFASWLEGEPLDVKRLLYTETGKPRLSILSIAHLSEAERMFFVTILLNEVVSWMRSQPGTGSLRALLYMDEVFGYFPPTANPPSKKPMLTLLKQARAYGLGVVLATQNPVDLDYKGLSNCGTWFLGRLQTERDKARVLEGLEGASAQAGSSFNKSQMEATLAGLGSRVFLMNNVHDNRPRIFHTRWAMSYLRGPMTRDQIRDVMADRKAALAAEVAAKPQAEGAAAKEAVVKTNARPVITSSIVQKFWPLAEPLPEGSRLEYRAGIFGECKLHYVKASYEVDEWPNCEVLQPVHGEMPEPVWDSALVLENSPALEEEPEPGAEFADLASALAQEKNYKRWNQELESHLYRTEKLVLWRCEELDEFSASGEDEADFRIRMTQRAREERDAKKEKVRDKFAKRLERAKVAVRKAEQVADEQKSQFWMRLAEMLWKVLQMFLSGSKRRGVSSTSMRQTMRERGEQSRAAERLEDKLIALEEIEEDLENALEQVDFDLEPKNLELEKLEVPLRKSDTSVDRVMLVWLPWQVDAEGDALVAY